MIAYFASFYLTFFVHLAPIELSGRILDSFLVLEHNFVDHMLLGLLEKNKKKILEFERQDSLLKYVKYEMIKETLNGNGTIEDILIKESVRLFKKGKISSIRTAIKSDRNDKKYSKSMALVQNYNSKN